MTTDTEYDRAYSAAHKAEKAEYNRVYHAAHKAEKAEYDRAYHATHKAEIAAVAASIDLVAILEKVSAVEEDNDAVP